MLSGENVPLSGVNSFVSNTSNTRSAETIPICKVLNLSISSRIGRKIILMYIRNATTTPGEIAFARICFEPYHTRRRSEEHTSELQSRENLVCRLLLEKKKTN